MRGVPDRALPSLEECIETNERAAHLTNPAARVIGLAINTSAMAEDEAHAWMKATGTRLGLPCCDPLRGGVGPIVDELAKM